LKKFEDILAECIDDIRAGEANTEDCLARYPSLRERLEPLLELAIGIRETPDIRPSSAFKVKARVQLMEYIHARAVTERPLSLCNRRTKQLAHRRRFSMIGVVIAIVLALSAAAGGTAYASQGSLPGDTLYSVKLATEQVRMALPGDDLSKAERALNLAERRVREMEALANSARAQRLGLVSDKYDDAMGAALAMMRRAGVKGLVATDVAVRIAEATARHLSALDGVYDIVPDGAKPDIERARNVSQAGHFRALQVLADEHPGEATEINLAATEGRLSRALAAAQAQNEGEVVNALEQFEEMSQFGLEISNAAWQLGANEEVVVGELVAGATLRHLSMLDDVADRAPDAALQALIRARQESMNRHREGLLAICEQDPAKAMEINLDSMSGRLERAKASADNSEFVEIALEQFEMMADFGEAISRIAHDVGDDGELIEELIAQATLIHIDVLAEVWEKAPELARESIEGVMARALIRHENRVHAMEQRGIALPDHAGVPAHMRERVDERIREQRMWDEREAALSPGIPGFAGGCPGCRR
jgi:hypothetical protein